jgi:cytochrome c oxidase cbb3-type subunit 3
MKTLLAVILILNIASVNAAQPTTLVVNANCNFEQTIQHVKQAAVDHNFRIVRERDLSVQGVRVYAIWFCNFELLNQAVHKHKKIGYMLPFRVTVVEHNGKISVSAANPDKSMKLVKSKFGNICNVVTAAYKAILEEASL